jgi:hypothetical protein
MPPLRGSIRMRLRRATLLMRTMAMRKITPTILKSAALGGLLGILAAHALFLGWWTLVPWGIGGLALGYKFKERFVLAGSAYGFALVFIFMIGQYTGERPLIGRLPAFALLGLFGAFCGLILTTLGSIARNYKIRSTRN